ncbi:MAG: class I SAM-dependent methyltransferase [Proteobacteria bacterium]|nr:class I SAM-dependent methyltransferase [Pseudomonadota bacterium]
MPTPTCQSYNKIAEWFDEARDKNLVEKEYLELILRAASAGSEVLDLGCGAGEPLARFFMERGYLVTGIDGSWKMIELCQKKFSPQNFKQSFSQNFSKNSAQNPQQNPPANSVENFAGNFFVADMRDLNLGKKFAVILAWDSFFHLTRAEQRSMFATFAAHILAGGILAFTSGSSDGEVWSDNNGEMLYHSSLSKEEYRDLLERHGFEVLLCDVSERVVWVAKKSDEVNNAAV